jgi:hypothetical protein
MMTKLNLKLLKSVKKFYTLSRSDRMCTEITMALGCKSTMVDNETSTTILLVKFIERFV